MVIELTPQKTDPYPLVLRVFLKSIELLGGLKKLAEFRTLTWLPSIARACFCVVLKEEYYKTDEEIAELIGLTKQTLRNILRADPDLAMKKIENIKELVASEKEEIKVHTAGGLAKKAYKLIKEGQEEISLFLEFSSQTLEALGEVPWAYRVLKAIKEKEIKFPISSFQELEGKLRGIKVKDKKIEELLPVLKYPINNPAQLLKKIKEALL